MRWYVATNKFYNKKENNMDKEKVKMLQESLEYFHDALYIYENMQLDEDAKKLTVSISKASQYLNRL